MGLLEVAMVSHSFRTAGLINYIIRIYLVVIVDIYLGIHVAHIYTKCWKIGLNEWKWVIGWWGKTVLLVVLRSSKRPILKDIGGNMLFPW